MGKGAIRFGYKSGILPSRRPILKRPTLKQTHLVEQAKQDPPKGFQGIGYAESMAHPKGSHRDPKPIEFVDVEQLVAHTVPEKKREELLNTTESKARHERAQLRRKYLARAFREEEQRLLKQHQLIEKRTKLLEEERQRELELIDQPKSSDLTVPSLERIVQSGEPLMRQRTSAETALLKLKRQHNRDLIRLQTQERRLDALTTLFHASSEFIVTEEKLQAKIDSVFGTASDPSMRYQSASTISASLLAQNTLKNKELQMSDALYGTKGGRYVGLPLVKEFLAGELESFAHDVNTRSDVAIAKRKREANEVQDS